MGQWPGTCKLKKDHYKGAAAAKGSGSLAQSLEEANLMKGKLMMQVISLLLGLNLLLTGCAAEGIMAGYGNGRFGPNDPVTRKQIVTILWRYTASPSSEAGQDFADKNTISSYAVDAVNWARASGIINGKDGNRFDPKGNLSRAEAAVILKNYLQMQ